jgi:hypothetical protein
MSYKRTAEGKRVAMTRRARRLTKYAVRPLDVTAILSTLPRGLKVA